MCIAILSPKGTQLSKESLNNCWLNNYNGAGFMYNDENNKLHVVKEMDDFEKFYSKYEEARERFPNSTMVLHFRISTHGIINRTNCHPFKVNNSLGFVHNGVIREVEDDDKYSDTNMFNRTILRKIPGLDIKMLRSKGMKKLMGEFIDYSKLVFMDNMNNYAIINEEKGHWNEGIWYSNDSYKKVKDTIDFGGKSISRNSLGSGSWGGSWGSSYSPGRTYDSWNYWSGRSKKNSVGYKSSYKPYKVSDGTDMCECCGIHLMDGELTSHSGECLDCVTSTMYDYIIQKAKEDGLKLKDWEGSNLHTVFDEEEKSQYDMFDSYYDEEKPNVCKCSNCDEYAMEEDLITVKDFPKEPMCSECIKELIEDNIIEDDSIGGDAPF